MMSVDQKTLPASEYIAPEMPYKTPATVRVLAVDDELPAAKLLSVFLSSPAFRCVTASGGAEALQIMLRQPFDAVISDLRMPGMTGMDLLAEVRRLYPHVAFLVTTGVDDVDVGVKAMRSGADDYLVKPLTQSVVVASLDRALHKQHLERQVEHYHRHLEEMVADRTAKLQEALQHVETTYEDTLRALGAAIDLRDSDTAGHSQRVCRYSLEIAGPLGLSETELRNLARGAYLHDIGKLGVPDGILLKPGPLSPEEWKLMQKHSQIGYDIVRNIPFLADVADMILAHHERFDGTGYPRGIKGEGILLSARIFAIADSFDAITSDRPYRPASPTEVGVEAIRSAAGKQFDPRVVEAFLSIPSQAWPKVAATHRGPGSLIFK